MRTLLLLSVVFLAGCAQPRRLMDDGAIVVIEGDVTVTLILDIGG